MPLTITLVGTATLLLQTLTNFHRVDLGIRPERLLSVTMDPGFGRLDRAGAIAYVRQAAAALEGLPGVQAVTYADRAMGRGIGMNLVLDIPGFAGTAGSGLSYAGPGFVRTLGMTLLAGRDFDETDRPDSTAVAIVNEFFATHFFGTVDAVGRSVALRGPGNHPIVIAGVVKDARDGGSVLLRRSCTSHSDSATATQSRSPCVPKRPSHRCRRQCVARSSVSTRASASNG